MIVVDGGGTDVLGRRGSIALASPVSSSAPPPFAPTDIANLGLWLDAADAASVTLNGSNVAQWNDKSGNAQHASQGTAANQPVYTTAAQNGKNVVTFDGVNDHLSCGDVLDFGTNTGRTVFVVGSASSTAQGFCGKSGASNQNGMFGFFRDTNGINGAFMFVRNDGTSNLGFGSGVVTTTGVTCLMTGRFDRAAGTKLVTVDGTAGTTDAPTVNAWNWDNADVFTVGAYRTSLWFLNGRICEFVLYERALTAPEVAQVQAYLKTKWGTA